MAAIGNALGDDDPVDGGAGDDAVFGDAGEDAIDGGAGEDTLGHERSG